MTTLTKREQLMRKLRLREYSPRDLRLAWAFM